MRTVIACQDARHPVALKLREMLRSLTPMTAELDGLEDRLRPMAADLLVLVLPPDTDRALETLGQVRPLVPGRVLAVGQTTDSRLILGALNEGADQYIDEADLETRLHPALSRLLGRGSGTHANGKLIAVLGAAGGVGASTVAVSVSTLLAKEHGRCALLDLKPGTGDLASLMDLKPAFNLGDVCLNAARCDQAMFESTLTRHACGVSLLAPPQTFDDVKLVTTQGVNLAVAFARQMFPTTVVDLENCHNEEQVAVLRMATEVVLVIRLDFTSVRNARRILEHLDRLDIPRSRVKLVANRTGQPKELNVSEVEEVLGAKLAVSIPDDSRTVNGANNAGIPVALKAASSKVGLALSQLAREVAARPATPPPASSVSAAATARGWRSLLMGARA